MRERACASKGDLRLWRLPRTSQCRSARRVTRPLGLKCGRMRGVGVLWGCVWQPCAMTITDRGLLSRLCASQASTTQAIMRAAFLVLLLAGAAAAARLPRRALLQGAPAPADACVSVPLGWQMLMRTGEGDADSELGLQLNKDGEAVLASDKPSDKVRSAARRAGMSGRRETGSPSATHC